MANWNRDFPTWSEFCEFAAGTPGGVSQDTDHWRKQWTGTPDFPTALRLGREGWPEGAARVAEITARLSERIAPHAFRRELAYSVAGPGTVDLHRYVMGHPEPYLVWQDSEDVIEANRGFLHLVINLSASSSVKADVLFTRGAAVCALVDALERDGYRCEVEVYCRTGSYDGRHSSEVRVAVKSASQPLEIEALAMAIAHPSTLRRLAFAVWEQAPAPVKGSCGYLAGGGYGMPQDTIRDKGDIHVPMAMDGEWQWQSVEAAARWVTDHLRRQGVEIEEE